MPGSVASTSPRALRSLGRASSPASGTLAEGAGTTVTVTLNNVAGTLAAGNYASAVSFTNTTNGAGSTSRALSLSAVEPLPAGTNALVLFSQPGDYIGLGQQREISARQASVTITAQRNFQGGVSLSFVAGGQTWSAEFAPAPGAGTALAAGAYENAVRFPFNNGLAPGLNVSGEGRGCNTLRGRFDVLDVAFAGDGSVQRFAADFVQHCDGFAPALFGQVRYNAAAPFDLEPALPAPFDFIDVVNASPATPVTSNAVAISGITSAPIRVQGGEYSIDGGPFTSAPGTIGNGQTVVLRLVSSALPGTPSFATVKIGAASATFQVTTALAPGTDMLYLHSQPGDFIGQGAQRGLHSGAGFTLTPSRNYHNGVSFNIQGAGESWTLDFAAPGRAQLTVGSYERAVRFRSRTAQAPA